MPCSCDRRGMWDRRVSIGQTLNENSGLSTLEPLMELIIEHCTGKCNHSISNEMVRYCPPSRTAKQLEEIRNFKQKGDETLYQAWERYNDLLYKCLTHDINNHQKVNIFYNGLGAMNRQLLNSQGPIPGMTAVQALTVIQTMDDHSQKWHDGSSSRSIGGSNSEGIAAIVNKLENLDCPLKEEVKSIEEAKYGEFGRPSPFSNGAKYRIGPPGYYTRRDNHPLVGKKRPSLEELMNKHLEESTQRKDQEEEWERSFDDYKWMFDLEIDQLADEYELGIGKKGHMLEDIWENCRKVQGDNTIDFENEFPAIVYNDALTSKSDFLTEPTIRPKHVDEFNLKEETSLSECDEKEQNVLYFNDIFPFNVIYPDYLKSDKDNDIDEIDIEQSSGDMSVIPLHNVINTNVGAYAQG
ncbi:putative ribonuclease H-like domain-containing protein [Tanacetum coccineum]